MGHRLSKIATRTGDGGETGEDEVVEEVIPED